MIALMWLAAPPTTQKQTIYKDGRNVDFLVVQDILNVEHPSKVEVYDDFNFVVSSVFVGERVVRVRLVQGPNVVLSFTEGESSFYDDVAEALRRNVLKIRSRS